MTADESSDRGQRKDASQEGTSNQDASQKQSEGAQLGDGGDGVQDFSEADWKRRRGQTWMVPNHFGYPKSVLMASSVGSPFLAGFSLTAAIVLISLKDADAPTLVDLSVAAFVAAAGLFIFAVHATYWARVYITTPKEMLDWWPEGLQRNYLPHLIEEQRAHWDGFDKWHSRAKWTYTFGVLALFAGLALAVFPGWGATWGWWLAFGIACLAFVFEVFWQICVVEKCLAWERRVEEGDRRPWPVRCIRPPERRSQEIEMPTRLDDKERL
ncbi:hypothetical protein ACFV90_33835 [Streptomyces sp. NPDC059904]|uniref:hypothetical protein n=1 Tax=Streptomyces sp. NPDC059904 TaxID=3346996 RepID=UPI003652F5AA